MHQIHFFWLGSQRPDPRPYLEAAMWRGREEEGGDRKEEVGRKEEEKDLIFQNMDKPMEYGTI